MTSTSHRTVQLIPTGPGPVRAVFATRRWQTYRYPTTVDFLDYCFARTDPQNGYFTDEHYKGVIRAVAEAPLPSPSPHLAQRSVSRPTLE